MIKCDLCKSELFMDPSGQFATCKLCGMHYGIDWLREKLRSNPQNVTGAQNDSDFDIRGGVLYRYNGNSETVTIPETVVQIGERAFADNLRIKTVRFPQSLKAIGQGAFHSCTSLRSVFLPEGLEKIGPAAFSKTAIEEIQIPAATELEYHVFSDCNALKRVTFLSGRTSIPNGIFHSCTALTQVLFPLTLKTIGGDAFNRCAALTRVVLPEGTEKIGGSAFENCKALEAVLIPSSVKQIDARAFLGCSKLKQVEMPDRLAQDYVFLRWVELDSDSRIPDHYVIESDSPWYIELRQKRELAKAREQEKKVSAWKAQGRCAFCGGQFKGIFFQECKDCHRSKNY